MTRIYAVGDIHGYLDELHRAHDLIAADRVACGDADATVVHLGDLADRGPNSAGVISYLMEGMAAGEPWMVIKGNHDRMFTHYMKTPPQRDPLRGDLWWLDAPLGGAQTLASYGVDLEAPDVHGQALAKVPDDHVAFLEALPLSHREGEVFFCHAGVRPGVALADQVEDDLVWIRGEFHASQADHGALIVHGHTPVDAATDYGNRINLDSGAGYGRPISAVVIEGREVWLLTDEGRVPLAKG